MKFAGLLLLTLVVAGGARADFTYTMARKASQGQMAAMGPQSTKHAFKGQKMKTESGDSATIIDFDAQTVTIINHAQKNYAVTGFSDLGKAIPEGIEAKIDLKETGQKKTVNGFNATQAVLTMEVDGAGGPAGMRMQMEMELWVSPDVPGAQEVKAFFTRNGAKFPWAAIGGGNASMQKSMADMQKKMSSLGGVAVQQIMRMKPVGGGAQAGQMAQAQAGMAQAIAQLEAMKKQGGPQAAAAEAAMARMGGAAGGGGGGGALFEITMEATDFSNAALADSAFAVPAGYQKR